MFADTTLTENMIRVRLQDQILFPSALSTLSPQAAEPIMKLARVLKELPIRSSSRATRTTCA